MNDQQTSSYFTDLEKYQIMKIYWMLSNKYSSPKNYNEFEEKKLIEFLQIILSNSQDNTEIPKKLGLYHSDTDTSTFIKPATIIQLVKEILQGIDSDSKSFKTFLFLNKNSKEFLVQATFLVFVRIFDDTKINQNITNSITNNFANDRIPLQYLDQLYLENNTGKETLFQKCLNLKQQTEELNFQFDITNTSEVIYLRDALKCIGLQPSHYYMKYLMNIFKPILNWFIENEIISQIIRILQVPSDQEDYYLILLQIIRQFLIIIRQESILFNCSLIQKEIINKDNLRFKKAINEIYQFQFQLIQMLGQDFNYSLKVETCLILAAMVESCQTYQQSREQFYNTFGQIIQLQFPFINLYYQAFGYLLVNLGATIYKHDLQNYQNQQMILNNFFIPIIELIKKLMQVDDMVVTSNSIISLQFFIQFLDDDHYLNEIVQLITLNLFKSNFHQKYVLRLVMFSLQNKNNKICYLILSNQTIKDFIIKNSSLGDIQYICCDISILIVQKYFSVLKMLPSVFLKDLLNSIETQIQTCEVVRFTLLKISEHCIKEFSQQQLQQIKTDGGINLINILLQILSNCDYKDPLTSQLLNEDKYISIEIFSTCILSLNELVAKGINQLEGSDFTLENLQILQNSLSKVLVNFQKPQTQQENFYFRKVYGYSYININQNFLLEKQNDEFWLIILNLLILVRDKFKQTQNNKLYAHISHTYFNYQCRIYGNGFYNKVDVRIPIELFREGQNYDNSSIISFRIAGNCSFLEIYLKSKEELIKMKEISKIQEFTLETNMQIFIDESNFTKICDQFIENSAKFMSQSNLKIIYKLITNSICRQCRIAFFCNIGQDPSMCQNCLTQTKIYLQSQNFQPINYEQLQYQSIQPNYPYNQQYQMNPANQFSPNRSVYAPHRSINPNIRMSQQQGRSMSPNIRRERQFN